jgi:hypothetical protein
MKNLIKISAIACLLVMISVAGFSQKACSIKIKNIGTSMAPYKANIVDLIITTPANAFVEASPDAPGPIYTGTDNNFKFTTIMQPAANPIFRYVVEVQDNSNPPQVIQTVSELFSSSDYLSRNIPVTINF